MHRMLTVTVSVKDTEYFKKMVDILKRISEDPTIPEKTKDIYREDIESLSIEGDVECMPDS